MKKALFSIIFVAAASLFFACNNGEYNANPISNANGSVNPLNTLDSATFEWTGQDAVSAYVNGTYFHADSTQANWVLATGGVNVITAFTSLTHGFIMSMSGVYGNNIYNMGYTVTNPMIAYTDSIPTGPITYYSYFGNVGQVEIVRNDAQRIIGRFHFQALNQVGGSVINVSNGWFNLHK